MSCVASRIASTPRPIQSGHELPWLERLATPNIATPRMIGIIQTQVRRRPNRSTIGLHRNLSDVAVCSPDVIEPAVWEAPIATRNSSAIWCRKLQGRPSPKYVVDVQSRFFPDFGAAAATVQRWSGAGGGAASFFPTSADPGRNPRIAEHRLTAGRGA